MWVMYAKCNGKAPSAFTTSRTAARSPVNELERRLRLLHKMTEAAKAGSIDYRSLLE